MATRESYAAFWEANRDEILETRRKRYLNDAKYRRAILKRSRAQAKLRPKRLVKRTKQMLLPVQVERGQKLQLAFYLSGLTCLLGQDRRTIRRMRRRKELPKPFMRHPGNGYDLWSERQMAALRAAAEEAKLPPAPVPKRKRKGKRTKAWGPPPEVMAAFVEAWKRRGVR